MSSVAINAINAGLDDFFDYQRSNRPRRRLLRSFQRKTMAYCIRRATSVTYSPDDVSTLLQQYRSSQPNDVSCKYHIAARGYGRSARWYVLSGPRLNVLDGEGMTMVQAEWAARDAASRVTSDYLHEIIPSAEEFPAVQPRIEATQRRVETALNELINDVRQDKRLWETANNRRADLHDLVSVEEEQEIAGVDGI